MKRYMAITFLGLILLISNIWYGVVQAQRTDRHLSDVTIAGDLGVGTLVPGEELTVSGSIPYARILSIAGGRPDPEEAHGLVLQVQDANSSGAKGIGTIYWASADSAFTTTNPKNVAYFGAIARETYVADDDGASGLVFGTATLSPGTGDNVATEAMRINEYGYVGINIIDPTNFLHVYSYSAVGGTQIYTEGRLGGYGSGISFMSKQNFGGNLLRPQAKIVADGTDAWTSDASTDSKLTFWTMNSNSLVERMVIDENGNVGIGTTDPDFNLEIESTSNTTLLLDEQALGDGNIVADLRWDALDSGSAEQEYGRIRFYATTDDAGAEMGSIVFRLANGAGSFNDKIIFQGDGNVGIGTFTPAADLHGADNGTFLWADGEADNVNKNGYWGVEHYDVDEEPFYAFRPFSGSVSNTLFIGGSHVNGNAATAIEFFTASNNTTLSGLQRWIIQSDGDLIPVGAGSLDIGQSGSYIDVLNHKTLTDRGCIVAVDPVEAMGILRNVHNQDYDVRMPSQKHIDHGLRLVDYSHFPSWIYDDGMYLDDETKEFRQGEEGVDVGGLVSLLMAATKDLDKRLASLENN